MAGNVAEHMGTLHPNIAPYGDIFECSDNKSIVLAVGSDKQFSKLVHLLGNETISKDTNFSHNPARVKNRPQMQKSLEPLFKKRTRNEWMEMFNNAKVPAGAIQSMDEVLSGATATAMILEEVIDGVATKKAAISSLQYSRLMIFIQLEF